MSVFLTLMTWVFITLVGTAQGETRQRNKAIIEENPQNNALPTTPIEPNVPTQDRDYFPEERYFPEEVDPTVHDPEDLGEDASPWLVIGVNLFSIAIAPGGTSANRLSFLGGIHLDLPLKGTIGVFTGAQVTSKGAKLNSGVTASALFVDVPAGLFIHHGSALSKDSEWRSHLGGFAAIPTGHLKSGDTIIQETKLAFGVFIETGVDFSTGHRIRLGGNLWAKAGITDSYVSSLLGRLQKTIEAGIGLKASF